MNVTLKLCVLYRVLQRHRQDITYVFAVRTNFVRTRVQSRRVTRFFCVECTSSVRWIHETEKEELKNERYGWLARNHLPKYFAS